MPASRFRGQIALGNDTASRLLQSLRELLQQKLALDFPAIWNSRLHWCKVRMLTAISLAVEIFALANNGGGPESLPVAGVDDPDHLLAPRYRLKHALNSPCAREIGSAHRRRRRSARPKSRR